MKIFLSFLLMVSLAHSLPGWAQTEGHCPHQETPESLETHQEIYPVIIIGGGPAGLSVGRELQKKKIPFLILEAGEEVGHSWHHMPDSLRLLSPWKISHLYGDTNDLSKGDHGDRENVKASDFARYLEEFAEGHQLPTLKGVQVGEVVQDKEGLFYLTTSKGPFRARRVVNATGYFSSPFTPPFHGIDETPLKQLHFKDYKNPQQIKEITGKENPKVLIVGKRLSAGQAMVELQEAGGQVDLSYRGKIEYGSVPGSLKNYLGSTLGPTFESWGLALIGNKFPKINPPMQGGKTQQLIDSQEVRSFPDIKSFDPAKNVVEFANGQKEDYDLVLFTTGFKPVVGHLKNLLKEEEPELKGTRSSQVPGLYFIGLDGEIDHRGRFLRGIRDTAGILAEEVEKDILHDKKKEKFFGREIEVKDLSASYKDNFVPMGSSVYSGKDVILAFSPLKYHTFLIIGDEEFHGRLFFNRSFTRKVKNGGVHAGIFFKFPEVSDEDYKRLQEYATLMKGHRVDTCLHGVCEVLSRGAGIDIPLDRAYSMTHLFSLMLNEGIQNHQGEDVPFEIYKTKKETLEEEYFKIRKMEMKMFVPGLAGMLLKQGLDLGRWLISPLNYLNPYSYFSSHSPTVASHFHTDPRYPERTPLNIPDEQLQVPSTYSK